MSCDNVVRAMQDELRAIGTPLGNTLVNLMPLYAKIRTVTLLRKEGSLNITLKPEEMGRPTIDKFHFQMMHDSQLYLWITFGFLICPEALAANGAVELLKMVLNDGYVTPVFKGTVSSDLGDSHSKKTVQLHQEYETLFNTYKSKTLNLTKLKNIKIK